MIYSISACISDRLLTLKLIAIKYSFRVRRKWNLFRYCTSVVSLRYTEYETELNEEQNDRSFGDKLSDFLDRNQVKIQLLTIYAGLIGIILEGTYSDISYIRSS